MFNNKSYKNFSTLAFNSSWYKSFSTLTYLCYPSSPDDYTKSTTSSSTNSTSTASLTEEVKEEVLRYKTSFDQNQGKPSFSDPGHPNYEELFKEHNKRIDYGESLTKYADQHSVQEKLREHEERCEKHVVDQLNANRPEVSTKKVIDYLNEKQGPHSEEYGKFTEEDGTFPRPDGSYDDSEDERYFHMNKKEGDWRDKVWYESSKHDNYPSDEEEYTSDYEEQVKTPSVDPDYKYSDSAKSVSSYEKTASPSVIHEDPTTPTIPPSVSSIPPSPSNVAEENTTLKRDKSEDSAEESNKRQKLDDHKQSPIDYVLEKQSTEMPPIYESDGGSD